MQQASSGVLNSHWCVWAFCVSTVSTIRFSVEPPIRLTNVVCSTCALSTADGLCTL